MRLPGRQLIVPLAAAMACGLASVRVTIAETVADDKPAMSAMSAQERTFFETKIRPVLVKHCYQCHSQEAKKLGGKLRLDTAAGLREGGESGRAVVAGQPDKSLIIQSLRHEHLEMPPKAPLSEAVVKDFETWVKMGAPDPRDSDAKAAVPPDTKQSRDPALWSFQPIIDPPVPAAANSDWARDPIDRFILARLAAEKLSPTRDASPTTLIRRLYFDLIGLPPSIEDVKAFESDFHQRGQAAVEALVDRLLASPQFGERWGRHWLDVARYGESNGNDGLGRNPTFPHAWRFRDYVIASFNSDVPYNRFITEQIAGDLLPAASPAERDRLLIATGFLALGAKPAKAMNINFDMDVVDDQINVVSTGIMGLSVACARCHDHKHDPIPTRDYYALAGIFKSTETLWGNAAKEMLTAPPTPLHELATIAPASQQKGAPAKPYDAGAPAFPKSYAAQITQLTPSLYLPLNADNDAVKVENGVKLSMVDYGTFTGGRLQGKLARPAEAYTISFWFRNDVPVAQRPVTAYLFSIGPDSKTPAPGDHLGIGGNYDKDKTGKLLIFNGNEGKQVAFGTTVIPPRTWNHLVYVRDGKRVAAYLNGQAKPEFEGEIDRTAADARTWFLGARNDFFAPLEGNLAQFAFFDHALSAEDIQLLHKASGQPRGIGKPLPARPNTTRPAPTKALAMGVRDRAKPDHCKINIKGESNKLGPEVPRGFLSACVTASAPEPINPAQSGRLELARWLTGGDHPQTARVMVNRIWLHLLGQGIVDTPDDFGVYGSRPTHPLLLDHLATRFMSQGWSIKRMIRAIVLSRTYQLDSHADADTIAADPDNRWLARHSRRRLDAESLRDSILKVSGQLDLSPAQGSDVQHMDVLVNKFGSLHQPSQHRSVYLCMLRNSPPPELAAFNLPSFETVTGQREVTTLPAHALYLLNNPFVVEQSERLASLALRSVAKDDAARVIWMYRRTLNREPSQSEQAGALKLIKMVEADLARQEASAEERRLSVWASLGQALLATNEFRYVD
ncbi:MAG: DUF1553 domain-containing protein [Phycisphaeraceae bacterium]